MEIADLVLSGLKFVMLDKRFEQLPISIGDRSTSAYKDSCCKDCVAGETLAPIAQSATYWWRAIPT